MKSKKKQYNIDEFLKEHELKLGEKENYDIKPSTKYAVLREALKNYYGTFQSGWGDSWKLGHFTIINNSHVELRSANGHDYVMNCYNAIIMLQMFLELYIVELLENIHPALVKGKLNKEIDILNVINWQFDTDFSTKKTIQFSEVLKRLEFLINYEESLPENIRINEKYHFFKDHLDTINLVLDLRNTMLHRGQGLLKDFALDLFWINHVIPVVSAILSIEDQRLVFLDRNTHCGINVLQELNSLNLDHNYSDLTKKDEFIRQLNYICHLKELGRASLANKKFMREFGDEGMEDRINQGTEGRRLEEVKELAALLKERMSYYEIYECPCCGLKSLLNFEPWTMFDVNRTQLHKAKCFQCSYSINIHIGEPMEYGIMNEKLFVYLN